MSNTHRAWTLSIILLLGVFSLGSSTVSAQKSVSSSSQSKVHKDISGRVLDQDGAPLPHATVRVQGSKSGAITDNNGVFAFSVEFKKNVTIMVSFIGMKTQFIKVTDKTKMPMTITLRNNSKVLGEVVANGMQVIKRDQMTGSAVALSAKDLRNKGITGIDRLLDGMVVGLNSTTISGAPGKRSKITIRGENALNGNTEPLWIVDGLPLLTGVPKNSSGNYAATIMQDGIGNIMPEDIQSIAILKDAAASAIYGARAANGVIVITTKKGFRSRTRVSYSGTVTYGLKPSVDLGMMTGADKVDYEKSIIDYYGLSKRGYVGTAGNTYALYKSGLISEADYKATMDRLRATNTNWMDVIFRDAISHQHNINLRGGSEELTYYTSITYNDQQGILKENHYTNTGLLLNMDYRPNKKWILSLNISMNNRYNRDNASAVDPFKYAIFANRYEKPYNDDGSYAPDLSYIPNNYNDVSPMGYLINNFNILNELRETKSLQRGLDGSFTFNLKFTPIKGLTLQSIFNRSISYNKDTREVNPNTYSSYMDMALAREVYKKYNAQTGLIPSIYNQGTLSESSGRSNSWMIRNQIDYSWRISSSQLLTFLAASEVISREFSNYGYTSPMYYNDYRITGLPNFDQANPEYKKLMPTLKNLYNTYEGQDRSVSFIGSMMYNLFRDRYVINFNIRSDGADIIGDGQRFTPLWSLGAKWNLHKEKLFTLPSFIRTLSLRSSFGYTGNIDRTAYPFSVIGLSDVAYMGNRIVKDLQFPNPSVKWEKKRDFNMGLEANLFSRLFVNLDYYNNRTDDILTNINVPNSTTRTLVKSNGGVTSNQGLELDVTMKWINNDDMIFSTSFNIARNINKILESEYSYSSYKKVLNSGAVRLGGVINLVGSEVGGLYGWKSAGVNPDTGRPRYYLSPDGKVEFAKMLDGWDALSPREQNEYRRNYVSDFNSIPDVVDMDNSSQLTPKFFRPSMMYLGRSNPRYVGGFGTYFKYKRFEFTTNWTFKTGHIIPLFADYLNAGRSLYNAGASDLLSVGYTSDLMVSRTNREKKYLGFWKTPGDITNVPRFVSGAYDLWNSLYTSDKYASGNYVRLNNVSFSYRFDANKLKSYHINNLQLSLIMRNLLTFTHYRGLDVATQGAFNYPTAREFSMKLSVGF